MRLRRPSRTLRGAALRALSREAARIGENRQKSLGRPWEVEPTVPRRRARLADVHVPPTLQKKEWECSCLKKAGGAGRYLVWRRRKAGSKVWVTAISSRYPHLFPRLTCFINVHMRNLLLCRQLCREAGFGFLKMEPCRERIERVASARASWLELSASDTGAVGRPSASGEATAVASQRPRGRGLTGAATGRPWRVRDVARRV